MNTRPALVISVLVLTVALGPLAQAEKPTAEEQKLLREVADKLLAKMKRPDGYVSWPPDIQLIDDDELPLQYRFNAFATFTGTRERPSPIVRVTVEWMRKVVQGDPDTLAYVLGHELGHLHHRHVLDPDRGKDVRTAFAEVHFIRKQEDEADLFGANLLIEAGYSLQRALMGQSRIKKYERRHSPLEALGDDHRSWDERFAKLAPDSKVWEAIANFNNGASFLAAEQFAAAELCFEHVLTVFPRSYEAWVNLGYARLMLYCDKLDEKDLKKFGVGKVLCGGFYRRAASLEPPTRGTDRDLWTRAVHALREADKLKPDLALTKANLGLAYLLHPDGKDAVQAARHFEEALEIIRDDRTIDPLSKATTLVNFAVTRLAEGNNQEARKLLAEAAEIGKALQGGEAVVLIGALQYNTALALAASPRIEEKNQAIRMMEQYLESDNPKSYWWSVAHEQYLALCQALEREPRAREALQQRTAPLLRMQMTVTLEGGLTVSLAEDIETVLKRLGKHTMVELADAALNRYRFEQHGIEVLAGDRVIAIILSSPKSPALKVRGRGFDGGEGVELKIGMSRREFLEKLPGKGQHNFRELTIPREEYFYYRHLGLAVNFDDHHPKGNVVELILVQVPSDDK